jgi:threonine dehydratase
MTVDLDDVRAAAIRIAPWVHRTPVMTCRSLDRAIGAEVFLKCENLQRAGAFKARGAHNAVFSLSDAEAGRGVVGTSSGNHAQALALAARHRGIPATVVMHDDAPRVKVEAVRGYGATIVPVAPDQGAREAAQREVRQRTGAVVIPPYDDDRVIAGQGTAALELLGEVPDLDAVLGPVGGGGLMSGTSIAVHGLDPSIRVVGAEPSAADDAFRSLRDGRLHAAVSPPRTIADGLLTGLSERTFAILGRHLEEIVTVDDEQITEAMRLVWTRTKLLVEPSAAVAVAAAMATDLGSRRVGIILSGGNVDPERLPW